MERIPQQGDTGVRNGDCNHLDSCCEHRSYSVHRAIIGATDKVSIIRSMRTCGYTRVRGNDTLLSLFQQMEGEEEKWE